MFKEGKYKTKIDNVTVFASDRMTSRVLQKGEVLDIVEIREDDHLGLIRGYLSSGEYIIMKNMMGNICVDEVKKKKVKKDE